MFEEILHNEKLLALIIFSSYKEKGIHFFTPDNSSLQLAYMNHAEGKIISAHMHNRYKREVHFTKEVLIIRKGKLRVDFYTEEQEYIKSRILQTGDVIMLSEGGHGFEVLEEIEMFEIKQGPYAGDMDKVRFEPKPGELHFD
jgi:mannose-6-phosphate isomerase-like protein (cupin superfamily)